MVKRHWKTALGVGISLLLIGWVLRGVNLALLWDEVRGANFGLLFAAVAVATSGFLLRALRWELLLRPIHPGTTLRNRFAAVNIGFAVNNLLPARVGEFARAWSLSRMEPVSASGAMGSLVAERVLDAVAIFLLLLVALLHPSFPEGATVGGRPLGENLLAVLWVIAGLLAVLFLLIALPGPFLGLVGRFTRLLPRGGGKVVDDILASFLHGLAAMRHPRLLVGALLWSLGFWAWNAVSFWLALQAFGIEQGYVTALFVQAMVAIGVSIPAAPGFFGTFHAAALVGLHEVYGVAEEPTLAFAFGYHLGGFIPVTLIGLWYAGQLGLTLSDLGAAEASVEKALDGEAE